MTTFSDLVCQLGGMPVLAGIPFGPKSKYYFVDPANGDNANPGTDLSKPLAGIEAAYAKTVSGQHDCVFYIAGTSSNNLAAAVTWSNSYTHLIGICAPSHVGQRARIFQTSTLTAASPLITVSGSGNIFKNLYIFQGVADATSLINVMVSGGRNYFENVHFAGGGDTTQAIDGGASLNLNGSASENKFVNCVIGVDTVAAATGMMGLLINGGTGTVHTTRNMFKDCLFTMKAGHSGSGFVELASITSIDRYTLFDRCMFINLASTTMASAFVVPAGLDPNDKRFLLKDCTLIGATDWDANDRSALYLSNGTITGGGNAGLFVVSAAT